MRQRTQLLKEQHPFLTLLLAGLILRVIASIYSGGYMGSDDHFQVIEMAAEWMRGNNPGLPGGELFYRSLAYPGANWLLMSGLQQIGIVHPETVMFIIRLVHGLTSLWTIALAYRLAKSLAGERAAWNAGLIVAAAFIMPYASVRNLIEVVAMPFLLCALYQIVRAERTQGSSTKHWLLAGLCGGLAFVIRWQVGSAMVGIGLYLMFARQWRGLILVVAGSLIPAVLQGFWDWSWHGVFLGSLWKSLGHNIERSHNYVVGPWYRYVLLLLGVFIPPFSILFGAAMVRFARRLGVLAWAVFAFIIIHSLIPGKQERFLLPIFAAVAVMGVCGLHWWSDGGSERFRRCINWGWRWYWAVNLPLLILACLNYSQKSRIESLTYIYERGDATGIIADYTERATRLPEYYLDGAHRTPRPIVYPVRSTAQLDTLRLRALGMLPEPISGINYAVIFSRGNPDVHVEMLREHFGEVEIIKHIEPSIADRLLNLFNPRYNHSKESWVALITATPILGHAPD
ncbi:MAG TPA: glycosyltransferase family 39 protein [candidate division Zixibacteria bacterium]